MKYYKDKRGVFACSDDVANNSMNEKYFMNECKEISPIVYYILYGLKQILYIPMFFCLILVWIGYIGDITSQKLDNLFNKVTVIKDKYI